MHKKLVKNPPNTAQLGLFDLFEGEGLGSESKVSPAASSRPEGGILDRPRIGYNPSYRQSLVDQVMRDLAYLKEDYHVPSRAFFEERIEMYRTAIKELEA